MKIIRAFVLVLAAAWALLWLAIAILTPTIAGAIFGWNLGPDGTTITYVTPGAPASRAGIRVGDRIDWRTLPLLGRSNLALPQNAAPGAKLHLTLISGEQARPVTLVAETWPEIEHVAYRAEIVAGLVLIAIGIALVYLRPTRMTWGFLLTFLTLGFGVGNSPIWAQSEPWKFIVANGAWAILSGLSIAGILIFMSRFPTDRSRGSLAVLDRLAIPLGAFVAALALFVDAETLYSVAPLPAWALLANQYLFAALFVIVAFGALITAYVLARGSDRQRIVPVLVAFALFVAGDMGGNIYGELYTSAYGSSVFIALEVCSMLALAVAVANGVVRHRVVDVSFAISRTLVYTVLTTLIVGAFVLIDFVSSKVLERLQIAIVLEACAALAFGVWLNTLHSRIDQFVDRVLFRRRHLAETRLQRAARALAHAQTADFIDELLVIEACDALALASAAVFRLEGTDTFVRKLAQGWEPGNVESLAREDHLVVNLLAALEPIDLSSIRWPRNDIPDAIAQPLLAVPFVVRHEVLGFVLYSGHIGGEAIDPDESRTLLNLAQAAGTAYEHVRSKVVLAEAHELRAENKLLAHERHLLREMVDALRSVTGSAK